MSDCFVEFYLGERMAIRCFCPGRTCRYGKRDWGYLARRMRNLGVRRLLLREA